MILSKDIECSIIENPTKINNEIFEEKFYNMSQIIYHSFVRSMNSRIYK